MVGWEKLIIKGEDGTSEVVEIFYISIVLEDYTSIHIFENLKQ